MCSSSVNTPPGLDWTCRSNKAMNAAVAAAPSRPDRGLVMAPYGRAAHRGFALASPTWYLGARALSHGPWADLGVGCLGGVRSMERTTAAEHTWNREVFI